MSKSAPLRGKQEPTRTDDAWDVLIVGAGPAGLFCALGVALTSSMRILVVDSGSDIEERRRAPDALPNRDLVHGVGGAGLFSDGKLCLSLGVGGALPDSLSDVRREQLLESVSVVFGVDQHKQAPVSVARRARHAVEAGLEFSHYPVLHLGTEHCANRVEDLRHLVLSLGATIAPKTMLTELERRRGGYVASVERGGVPATITTKRVVLAMGKVGASFESALCRGLGVRSTRVPMYIGCRVEAPAPDLQVLFKGIHDPKYKMYIDATTKVKTHCAGEGGYVLPVPYEGLPLAGGHSYRTRSSGKSGFAVLWNGLRNDLQPYEAALEIMRKSTSLAKGRLLAQRLCDLMDSRSSEREAIARARPSTSYWTAGNIREALPSPFFGPFERFVRQLSRIAPGLYNPETLVFAPAIEWWMDRVVTDESLQTDRPGLFVAGDGGGWSQGIIHAAASGLVVAEGMTGNRIVKERLRQAVGRVTAREGVRDVSRLLCPPMATGVLCPPMATGGSEDVGGRIGAVRGR